MLPPRLRKKPVLFSRAGQSLVFHRGWFWLAMRPSELSEHLTHEIQHYGVVRVGSLDEAQAAMTLEPERWAGLISEGASDGAKLSEVRRMFPDLPCLALDAHTWSPEARDNMARDASSLESLTIMSFVQRAFVQAYLPDERVAQVVVDVARRIRLTAREVQLLCFCLGDEPRSRVRKRLGISENTLKTQVRGLLRKAGQRNVNVFAKNVLREALLLEREARKNDAPSSGRGLSIQRAC